MSEGKDYAKKAVAFAEGVLNLVEDEIGPTTEIEAATCYGTIITNPTFKIDTVERVAKEFVEAIKELRSENQK